MVSDRLEIPPNPPLAKVGNGEGRAETSLTNFRDTTLASQRFGARTEPSCKIRQPSSRLRNTIEPRRILVENACFGRFADVFALLQHARGAALAIAVGHVAAENDLPLAHEVQHVRQYLIFDFRAEVNVAALSPGSGSVGSVSGFPSLILLHSKQVSIKK